MKSKLFQLSIELIMLSLLLVGVVSASYPMFHYDGQRTGYVPEDGPQNNTIRWKANLGEFIGAPPIEKDGRVYVGVWPDMNFAAGEEYYLYCLNATDGSEIWKNPLGIGEGTVSGAAVSGDRLYAGCMDGNLYCIDTTDGTTLWSAPVDAGRGGGNWHGLASCPAVLDNTIYVTSLTDGTLHAFDPDGIEIWTYATGNATFAYTSPAADAGRVYFAGNTVTDALYCIDAATHQEVWNTTTDGQIKSSPVISGGTVFAASANQLYALNTSDGSERWSTPISASWGTPAVAGGYLYLGTNGDSALHCYNAATGAEEWSFAANGKIDTSPVVANDIVYFASNTGSSTVYAVDTAGNEVWQYATTNYLQSSPAVSDGVLYIGSDEGNLYAFGEGSVLPTPTPIPTQTPTPTPTPAPGSGNRTVTLVSGEIFTVTPFNNASAAYTINRTSALGALDTAATAGGFNYTLKEESWGSFLYSIAGIAYNETSWDSWLFMVNGAAAGVGAADYQLVDGDVVTYWYGGWGSTPETSDHVIRINVNVRDFAWEGTVSLTAGQTFTVTPYNNASAVYTVNRTSALGALDAAATAGEFNYTLKEESWGSYLYSIAGIAYNETSWDSWLYTVNSVTADVGAADYQLVDGDVVTCWYGGWGSTPATANAVVNITVSIPTTPTPTPGGGGGGGGDSPSSWITVTLESDTFNVTAENSGTTYTVDRQTALGALDASGTSYTLDDSYYQEYGSLFLNSVRGRTNEGTKGWMYQVNGVSPSGGANVMAVANGDKVVFYWSESMSATPATSSDVISIRVTIPASGGSGSGSSIGGSGSSSSSSAAATPGSSEPGAAIPSFFLGLPAGAAIELGEWGQAFSFDTGRRNTSEEQVTVSGNSFIIKRNGLTMVLAARNINEKNGKAAGLIESITASIEPVTANISTMGTVAASLDLNLTGIPGDGRIEISFNETPDAGAANAFHLAATEN
ncbi:MAG: PQQ-binding-like beta-propeller repeat protein, partial [Methanomicrobiales archaeon]|nr:PQQ-binding-like beta-propeller repeat protein [Methanomicrobiales archaeon]